MRLRLCERLSWNYPCCFSSYSATYMSKLLSLLRIWAKTSHVSCWVESWVQNVSQKTVDEKKVNVKVSFPRSRINCQQILSASLLRHWWLEQEVDWSLTKCCCLLYVNMRYGGSKVMLSIEFKVRMSKKNPNSDAKIQKHSQQFCEFVQIFFRQIVTVI